MRLLIVSGRYQSGTETALKALQDLGWRCVDALPVALLPALVENHLNDGQAESNLAVVIDARSSNQDLAKIDGVLTEVENMSIDSDIVFFDSGDAALIKKFSETRRRHPLTDGQTDLRQAIDAETEVLKVLLDRSVVSVDTSMLSEREIAEVVRERFASERPQPQDPLEGIETTPLATQIAESESVRVFEKNGMAATELVGGSVSDISEEVLDRVTAQSELASLISMSLRACNTADDYVARFESYAVHLQSNKSNYFAADAIATMIKTRDPFIEEALDQGAIAGIDRLCQDHELLREDLFSSVSSIGASTPKPDVSQLNIEDLASRLRIVGSELSSATGRQLVDDSTILILNSVENLIVGSVPKQGQDTSGEQQLRNRVLRRAVKTAAALIASLAAFGSAHLWAVSVEGAALLGKVRQMLNYLLTFFG